MTEQAPVAVSLIVSTIGQTDRLPRLAASLARQSRRDFELILVDQAPAGRLDPFLRDLPPWLCVTRILSARGLSRGRNAGLALARGAIIGMPDDDAWLPDGLIADLVARFAAHPELSFISGVTRDAQGKLSNGRFLAVETPVDRRTVWQAGNSNGIFFRSAAARAAGGAVRPAPSPVGLLWGLAARWALCAGAAAAGHGVTLGVRGAAASAKEADAGQMRSGHADPPAIYWPA